MTNSEENIKSTATNSYLTKKTIFKAGLREYNLDDLIIYFEALVELINEKKG